MSMAIGNIIILLSQHQATNGNFIALPCFEETKNMSGSSISWAKEGKDVRQLNLI